MLKGARVEKMSAEEDAALKQANPSFDDLELTAELYKEMVRSYCFPCCIASDGRPLLSLLSHHSSKRRRA